MDGSEGQWKREINKLKQIFVEYYCEDVGGVPIKRSLIVYPIHIDMKWTAMQANGLLRGF